MRLPSFASLLLPLASLALPGCPSSPMGDGGMDASAFTPRGYVRWSSVACPGDGDGGVAPADACSRPTPHASVTGLTTPPDATKVTCAAQVQMPDGTIAVSFDVNETFNPGMWPGSLSLRGMDTGPLASPTTVGQQVTSCEVRLNENGHQAVGHCGNECTVTITNYYAEEGTITGTILCHPIADDSSPTLYRNVVNGQGVPGMNADFALTGCLPPSTR